MTILSVNVELRTRACFLFYFLSQVIRTLKFDPGKLHFTFYKACNAVKDL